MRYWNQLLLLSAALGATPCSADLAAYDLAIEQRAVNVTGTTRAAVLANGTLPAPKWRWREGDNVTLYVSNGLPESTSIHWHGILLPDRMDGVPGISFPGIPPGTPFVYRFPLLQSGILLVPRRFRPVGTGGAIRGDRDRSRGLGTH